MKAFRIGPVLCTHAPVNGHSQWLVTRETWLRVALTEEEAITFARQMATPFDGPFCSDPIVPVESSLHAG